jgi:hypothetical protein
VDTDFLARANYGDKPVRYWPRTLAARKRHTIVRLRHDLFPPLFLS